MVNRTFLRSFLLAAVAVLCLGLLSVPVQADTSHARIVRLSLVQGDVRFAREAKGDPLADHDAVWERAELNLPIRQGYVLATDNGRAEVEFENGAMAFLAENSVLEFFDLSLEDGSLTTRLVLRQGSGEFYVNPARGDYFSVTGGDFSVQADGKATFRVNNFDDGSDVNVVGGRVSVLNRDQTTPLEKGQFLSMKAGDADSITVDRSPVNDEFDQWVSGRIDSIQTASNAALQYSNSYGYTSGFGDLYTYGSWFSVAGYGYCWRPYGVGLGWSPFDYGNWYFDPAFGWTFLGSQPWGWLPFHYGGWIFRPGFGWVWNPGNSFWGRGRPGWRPVTGVFVRSGGSMGIVPLHPMDSGRKTPLNITQGVFPVTDRGIAGPRAIATGEDWKVEKRPSRNVMAGGLVTAGVPARLSRTMTAEGAASSNAIFSGRNSSIVYDPTARRFINANNSVPRSEQIKAGIEHTMVPANASPSAVAPVGAGRVTPPVRTTSANGNATAPSARTVTPPRATVATPAPVPRATVMERSSGGGGASWGGTSASRGSSGGGASRSSGSSGGSSGRSSGGGSSGSGGGRPSGGGGRPH